MLLPSLRVARPLTCVCSARAHVTVSLGMALEPVSGGTQISVVASIVHFLSGLLFLMRIERIVVTIFRNLESATGGNVFIALIPLIVLGFIVETFVLID